MGFPSKNTGAGCHFLLQGNFPTQGSNLHLLQADSLLLSHQGDHKGQRTYSVLRTEREWVTRGMCYMTKRTQQEECHHRWDWTQPIRSRPLISRLTAPSSLIKFPLVTLVLVQFKAPCVTPETQTNIMAALWVTGGAAGPALLAQSFSPIEPEGGGPAHVLAPCSDTSSGPCHHVLMGSPREEQDISGLGIQSFYLLAPHAKCKPATSAPQFSPLAGD